MINRKPIIPMIKTINLGYWSLMIIVGSCQAILRLFLKLTEYGLPMNRKPYQTIDSFASKEQKVSQSLQSILDCNKVAFCHKNLEHVSALSHCSDSDF